MHEPVLLIICDGWGIAPEGPGNAVSLARTPFFDALKKKAIYTTLRTSSEAVGLPSGQMGNSEVGHLNLGAGQVVYQDIMLITRAIQDGSFFTNPILLEAYHKAKNGTLHLMGLLSDGGVHSDMGHLKALITGAKQAGVPRIVIDAFLDGRDTPPKSALRYIEDIKTFTNGYKDASFATMGGRFFGMDRDKRWERVAQSYETIIQRSGPVFETPEQALEDAYQLSITDEFVIPCRIGSSARVPITAEDVFIFFNYRSDRTREMTHALTDKNFSGFDRGAYPIPHFYCMTPYDDSFTLPILFPKEPLENTLGEVISRAGYRQLRIAETEKYAHVTFFFNGGREEPFPGEDRILVPSPQVPTYDLQPEMSALQVTEKLINAAPQKYDFILLNFANLDMVGHTGVIPATVHAVETIDSCLGRLYDVFSRLGYNIMITADHGNAEQMVDELGNTQTAHSMNEVPFLFLPPYPSRIKLLSGRYLRDVAELVLDREGIEKPKEMNESRILA